MTRRIACYWSPSTSSHHLQPHLADAGADEADLAGGAAGQVDDAALVGEAVVDAHDHAAAAGEERDLHPGAEGEVHVRGGHLVLVEDLAARGLPAVVARAVPGGDAFLHEAHGRGHGGREFEV